MKTMQILRRRWFQIIVSGLLLLFLVEWTLVATGDPNYVTSAILLGAFLVPVTFVTYLCERLPSWDVPLPPVAICFIWGGVLGTAVILHALWDTFASVRSSTCVGFLSIALISLLRALVNLKLLIRRVREASD
jgi:RsiW-degrading membrane proteinase PrsW (M82 family)